MDGITQTKDSLFNVTDSAGNSKFIVKIEVKAWKTHAFLLPDKESINVCSMQPDDSDIRAELDKNCIYFLLGKQNETNSIYIGQAGTRSRDKKTVLARLDEHKKSKTEKYRGAWNTIIILTTDDDHWRSTELDYIEHLFVEIAEQAKKYAVYTDRTKPTVPYDGATISDCKETIKQGIGYAQKLGCMAFNMADNDVEIKDTHIETEPPIQKQTNISFSISNYKVDADKTVKGITEVITPDWIVSDMLDLLPWNTFNKTTKFLDPACKSGEFLTAIFHRLYELEMSNGEFSQFGQYASQMCIKHILSNQLYGLATSEESALLTQINLYTMYDPSRNIKYIPNYIDILKGVYDDNLLYECIDARTYRIQKIHLPSELIHQSVKDLRKKANKEQADKLVYEEVIYKEFGENMKFDVVIGNPPYQKTTGKTGNKGVPSGTTIYDNFVHMGIGISKNIVCMITPTKWFCGNKKLDALRNVLISDYLRELHILNAKDIFPNIIMDKIRTYATPSS